MRAVRGISNQHWGGRDYLAPTLLAALSLIWLAAALAGLTGFNTALLVPALGSAVAIPIVVWPNLAVALLPLAAAVALLPLPRAELVLPAVIGLAFASGFVRSGGRQRLLSLLPVACAIMLGARALLAPDLSLAPNGSTTYAILGLMAGAAAIVAVPRAETFLGSLGILGAFVTLTAERLGNYAAEGSRTDDTFGLNANGVGLVTAIGILACLLLWRRGMSRTKQVLLAALVAVQASGLILSQSQGAILTLAVGVVVLAFMRSSRRAFLLAMVVAAVFGFLVWLVTFRTGIASSIGGSTRTAEDAVKSAEDRIFLTSQGLATAREHLLTGIGSDQPVVPFTSGNFGLIYQHPHDLFIRLPLTYGLPIALAIFALAAWPMIAFGSRNLRRLVIPLTVAMIVAGLTNEWYQHWYSIAFWVPIGLLVASGRRQVEKRPINETKEKPEKDASPGNLPTRSRQTTSR